MTEPKIIFEDKTILVIDKPAGLVVNRAKTIKEKTVQDWLEDTKIQRGKDMTRLKELDFVRRSGIVHRLDKETSGLLVIAKTSQAFENLQKQFFKRQVKKRYLALVHGKVMPKGGVIELAIARSPFDRKKFGVFLGGRPAKTKYKVIAVRGEDGLWVVSRGWEVWMRKNLSPLTPTSRPAFHLSPPLSSLTLLELVPTTGRTHQLRVHLKYIGHPVVGDEKYAGRKTARADRLRCPRQFLHASYLSFIHPKTGRKIKFLSPLPKELKKCFKDFTQDQGLGAGFTPLR